MFGVGRSLRKLTGDVEESDHSEESVIGIADVTNCFPDGGAHQPTHTTSRNMSMPHLRSRLIRTTHLRGFSHCYYSQALLGREVGRSKLLPPRCDLVR